MYRIRLHAAMISVAVVLAGCAPTRIVSGPPLVEVAPAVTQPPQAISGFVRGRFCAMSAPSMVSLAIENDGRFRLYLDDAILDSGMFYVTGSEVIVDSMACGARGNKPAAYTWLYSEKTGLSFSPLVPDPCPERQQYLAEGYQPQYMLVFNMLDDETRKERVW